MHDCLFIFYHPQLITLLGSSMTNVSQHISLHHSDACRKASFLHRYCYWLEYSGDKMIRSHKKIMHQKSDHFSIVSIWAHFHFVGCHSIPTKWKMTWFTEDKSSWAQIICIIFSLWLCSKSKKTLHHIGLPVLLSMLSRRANDRNVHALSLWALCAAKGFSCINISLLKVVDSHHI